MRSSATAEDLPYASFAGQQDTYLNVVGDEPLLDAVRRCWASLWTDRAVSLPRRNGIDPGAVRLAVVVQRMVEAEVAGVLFTANPLTGRRRQAVIDASPGLGEAVVSGAVNPDHFVVIPRPARSSSAASATSAWRSGHSRRRNAARRAGRGRRGLPSRTRRSALWRSWERGSRRTTGSRRTRSGPSTATGRSGCCRRARSRPCFPLPAGAPATDDDLRVYFSFNVAQGVYRPLTPMGIQAFRLVRPSS